MKLIRFITIFFIAQLNISVFSDNIKIRENQIFKNLRCLVCQGQSISESNSDFANTIKLVVKDKLSEVKIILILFLYNKLNKNSSSNFSLDKTRQVFSSLFIFIFLTVKKIHCYFLLFFFTLCN